MAKPRPVPKRMLWFKIRDAGNRMWRVYLVDRCINEDDPNGSFLGLTHYDRRTIEVSVRQGARELATTLIHELMHACGGTRAVTPVEREGEEMFIQRAERSMAAMVRQLGGLVPPLPPGVRLAGQKRRAA